MVLVDTGAIIALLDRNEKRHGEFVAAFRGLTTDAVTTFAVVTEAMYFLGNAGGFRAQQLLWGLLRSGSILCAEFGLEDFDRAEDLMKKYADRPMDLADATIVVVGEREGTNRVLTMDYDDFATYRLNGNKRFVLEVPPPKRKR